MPWPLASSFIRASDFALSFSRSPGVVSAMPALLTRMSSVAAWGIEAVPHYSAAKAGILGFTRAVAREVASRKIRVNAICPGYIDTPMTQPMSDLMRKAVVARTPLGRYALPNEVAQTALFLASDDSSFFTGQWLSPNGGLLIA